MRKMRQGVRLELSSHTIRSSISLLNIHLGLSSQLTPDYNNSLKEAVFEDEEAFIQIQD
jgi:hypothetical protein